jgi:hypothetical protein
MIKTSRTKLAIVIQNGSKYKGKRHRCLGSKEMLSTAQSLSIKKKTFTKENSSTHKKNSFK